MNVVKHIICELTGYRPGTVDVSQGDRGSRAVSCRLLENGAPWMIPEGATARVAYTLPDGTEGLYDALSDGSPAGTIVGNIVTVELADQIMDQAGMVQVSILVIGPEGGQLATWPIRVMVLANKAAQLTVPEKLPPYGAGFAGKLFYGGADGTITPLGLGDGVRVKMMANGAMVLVGEGGGPSEGVLTELRVLADRVNAALNSDDITLDQLSEIVAYIKSNKTLIDAITTSKVSVSDIVNNLTTNVANKPLSAAQGVVLAGRIEAVRKITDEIERELADKLDADELPGAVEDALSQAKESGAFDGPAGPQGPQGDPGPAGAPGAPGDDYVLTDADRKEIAGIAAGLVPNANGGFVAQAEEPEDKSLLWIDIDDETDELDALATKEYVNHAIGEATKENAFELIERVETTEEVTSFIRDKEPDGTPYDFKRLYMYMYTPKAEEKVAGYIQVNDKKVVYSAYVIMGTEARETMMVAEVRNGALSASGRNAAADEGDTGNYSNMYKGGFITLGKTEINKVSAHLVSDSFPIGTVFEIWGVRA